MIDSYHPDQVSVEAAAEGSGLASIGLGLFEGMMDLGDGDGDELDLSLILDDARLTATAFYMRLLGELDIAPLSSPVLLASASEPIGGEAGAGDWRARWQQPHDLLEVPGNHLSMMDAHAETTAETISRWIETAVDGALGTQTNEGREIRA
jgi:hypothetical protein